MKKIVLWSLITVSALLSIFTALGAYPYYIYSKLLKNDYENSWFEVRDYSKKLLIPDEKISLNDIDRSNEDLWKKFHFMDVVIPLPVKNPFYNITASIGFNENSKKKSLGLVVLSSSKKELLKIFFNQNTQMPSVLKKQKLFKLPIIRAYLESINDKKIWKDLFQKDISKWKVSFKEMIYHLYLLELRSRVIPKNALSYSTIDQQNSSIIVMPSKDKDYKTEFILTRSRGQIYSYLLLTKKGDPESQRMRLRLLDGIEFRVGSEYLSRIIYQEFQNLDFKDKTSNEGMLYLLSAWSHDKSNQDFIQEMIHYLERGASNDLQLIPLIEYAFKKYQKTFVTKDISRLDISDKIKFASFMELEKRKEDQKIKDSPVDFTIQETKSVFQKKMESSKKSIKSKRNRMIIE